MPVHTHMDTENKLCIETPIDVHNMDKSYISFKPADNNSLDKSIPQIQIFSPSIYNMSAWFVYKATATQFVVERLMLWAVIT